MEWAICFDQAEIRAQEIYEKIGEQRREVAEGKSAARDDDEAWRADLLAQIEAQGGIVEHRGRENSSG